MVFYVLCLGPCITNISDVEFHVGENSVETEWIHKRRIFAKFNKYLYIFDKGPPLVAVLCFSIIQNVFFSIWRSDVSMWCFRHSFHWMFCSERIKKNFILEFELERFLVRYYVFCLFFYFRCRRKGRKCKFFLTRIRIRRIAEQKKLKIFEIQWKFRI